MTVTQQHFTPHPHSLLLPPPSPADVNTLVTVVAVNLHLLPENSFEEVVLNPKDSSYGEKGSAHVVLYCTCFACLFATCLSSLPCHRYFFTQFEGMDTFYCFQNNGSSDVDYRCFIKVGRIYALPMFNHAGYDGLTPSYCECDDLKWRQSAECNMFHFLTGFLFFDFDSLTETAATSVERMTKFMFEKGMTAMEINRHAYDISYDTNNLWSDTRGNLTWRAAHYEFCRAHDGKYCSLVSIYKTSLRSSVTNFHFPVYNGSCNDFISFSAEAAERFFQTPPTDLIEPYLKCHRTTIFALQDTLGIVSGNITAMTPVLMLAVFYLFYFGYIRMCAADQEVTYKRRELEDIARYFNFNLALARDNIHPIQLRAEAVGVAAVLEGGQGGAEARRAVLEGSVFLRLLEELRQEEVACCVMSAM